CRSREGLRTRDERQVREGLREVADEALGQRVVLLGEQAHVVLQGQEPAKQLLRLRPPSDHRERVDEPEAAREKGALTRRQGGPRVRVRALTCHETLPAPRTP